MEEWKDIKNWEGYYQISNLGNIRSLDRHVEVIWMGESRTMFKRGRVLSQSIDKGGYSWFPLQKRRLCEYAKIHRLVAETFLIKPDGDYEVNHKDCNKRNNSAENLEWCTHAENMAHSIKNKLWDFRGENGTTAKLKNHQVIEIRAKFTGIRGQLTWIANEYGVNPGTISQIVKRKTHVDAD